MEIVLPHGIYRRKRALLFANDKLMSPEDLRKRAHRDGTTCRAESGSERLRVLLVEDHDDTRMSMEMLLRRAGYYVRSAESAAAALSWADKEKFDLAVTDIGLPDLSGRELMKQLSERHGMRGIATTGYGENESLEGAGDEFIHHLTKPIKMDRLRALLEDVWIEMQSNP